jgi:ceramide glucosyltransferase
LLVAAVEVLKVLLLALVALSLLSTLLSHVFTWYYFASYDRRFPTKGHAPPVSIIKPIKGVDQSALDNFRSFCEQDYPNDYEILFCVEGSQDPSVPVIQQVIQEYPDVDIGIVFSDPEDPRSVGKLKNMIAGYGASSHDVIVFSDSDAHAQPTFLRETVACTGSPKIGLGFGAPAYGGSKDWGAALMAVCANSFVLRLASMCLFGVFDGAVGTTMAVRRGVIEQVGGLKQFGRQVTDDLPLARAIRNEGYRIHLLKQPARIVNRHYGFKRWWSHLHRWTVIIRHYWPNNFLITGVVDLAPWWALFYLALTLAGGSDAYPGAFLLAAVLGASVFSAAVVNTRFAGDEGFWRYLWVVPVLEFLRLPLLIYSGLTSDIVWRGRRLRIDPDGTTTIVAEHAGKRAEL